MISLVTNVCPVDDIRITNMLPHWLEVFGNQIGEILIILDNTPLGGRFLIQHGGEKEYCPPAEMRELLSHLASLDSRIRIIEFDEAKMAREIARVWFKFGTPMRAQHHQVIISYVCGINFASGNIILKVDCDMSFYEAGWLAAAAEELDSGKWDLLEPARGFRNAGASFEGVSTRAFLLHKAHFFKHCLPMFPHMVDPLRIVHRLITGRTPWWSIEGMFTRERNAGRIRHSLLSSSLGCSFHLGVRNNFKTPNIKGIIQSVASGGTPDLHKMGSDFDPRLLHLG